MTARQHSLLWEFSLTFAYIMALIWLSTTLPKLLTDFLAFAGVAFLCWRLKQGGDTWADLGFLVPEAKDIYWLMIGIGAMIFSSFFLIAIGHFITPRFWEDREMMERLSKFSMGYFSGVMFQQFLLSGYFANRISKIWPGRNFRNAIGIGLLFGIIHLPNPVLMVATAIFGTATSWYFQKSRNIYFLILAHLVLSKFVDQLIAGPLLIKNAMRVGPAFWQ